jgi:hypothetical protein
MSGRMYLEIPGTGRHQLPPLLLHGPAEWDEDSDEVGVVSVLPEAEEMLAESDAEPDLVEQRKLDLALQMAAQYKGLVSHWLWGDSVLAWIRQCEITFESEDVLRHLLHPDVWPHASRASFVQLLLEKNVPTNGVALERAVGLRLTFREPPPIQCFSNQFLFFLNSPVAETAYRTWSHLALRTPALLPPERFAFDVVDVGASSVS